VSMQEAMAYEQSSQGRSASSTGTTGSASTMSRSNQNDAALMNKLMELARAYGQGGEGAGNSSGSLAISV
jgi:hypothetical protein